MDNFEVEKFIENFKGVQEAHKLYNSLNLKPNQALLKLLADKGSMTTTEIYRDLGLTQPEASQRIGSLRRGGVIRSIRDGRKVYHALDIARIEKILRVTEELMGNEIFLLENNQHGNGAAEQDA